MCDAFLHLLSIVTLTIIFPYSLLPSSCFIFSLQRRHKSIYSLTRQNILDFGCVCVVCSFIKRVWRYQMGESESVIRRRTDNTMAKRKRTKRINNNLQNTKVRATWTSLKTGSELGCSGRVGSSCSISGTRRITLATNTVINHEWGTDKEVLTTNGTYALSFVTQIFRNGSTKTWWRTLSLVQ
jgi:hypothetical protein